MNQDDIILKSEQKITTVVLSGKLESGDVYCFKIHLDKIIDLNVIFDFSQLLFIDSAGLGALIGFFKQIRKKGGDVKIVLLNPTILKMFEITRMDRVFKLYASRNDAISAFNEELFTS